MTLSAFSAHASADDISGFADISCLFFHLLGVSLVISTKYKPRLLYREGRKQESYDTGNGLLFLLWQTPSGQQFWELALFVKCLLRDVLVVYTMVNLPGIEIHLGKSAKKHIGLSPEANVQKCSAKVSET